MKYVLAIGFIVIFFGLAFWWRIYKYHDCRRVGHATMYCILDNGS